MATEKPMKAAALAGKARRAHGANPRQKPRHPASAYRWLPACHRDRYGAESGASIMRALRVSQGKAHSQ